MTTFLPRTHKNSNNSRVNSTDALKLIDYILSLDKDNRISVTGKLYKIATEQYNESVRNTLIRPPIPTWFCGKIESSTGMLLTTESDAQLREQNGTSPITPTASSSPISGTIPYPIDNCLPGGTPGSPGYASCSASAGEDTATGIDISSINWTAEVYSVAEAPPLPNNSGGSNHSGLFGHIVNDIGDWFAQLGW